MSGPVPIAGSGRRPRSRHRHRGGRPGAPAAARGGRRRRRLRGSLARVDTKAQAAGVGDRVRTLVADLDAGWPDLAPIDLTWASMSLHHLADPSARWRTYVG